LAGYEGIHIIRKGQTSGSVPALGVGLLHRFAARLGKTTPDEEDALLEYLQFLRSRKR
jgi:hypothetical protein